MTQLARAVVAGTLAVTVAAPVAAQAPSPSPQPTFRSEVSVVEVVAVVTGEDDRSLTDLHAVDFELREDGEVRPLLDVRRLSTSTRDVAEAPLATGPSDAVIERLATNADVADAPAFVLLLDDLDTSPYDSHRMIRAAKGALAAIPREALAAVVTTSGVDGSLFTLARPNADHVARIEGFRGRLLLRAGGPATGGTTPSAVNAPCGAGPSITQSLDCADPTRAARRAAALGSVAELLGRAGSRRKVIFWLTVTMGVSPLDPDGNRRAQRDALRAALDNDVTVYVLDPRENYANDERIQDKRTGGTFRVGPADSTFGGPGGGVIDLEVDDMVAVPLTQITRETGGRYITMANDLDQMLGRIVEQNTTAYMLSYESPVARQPGLHRIEVNVRRRGARVSARRRYIVEPGDMSTETVATSAQARLLRDTLLGTVSQGSLPITVHVVPWFASGRTGRASVTIRVEPGVDVGVPVDVLLATVDEDGRLATQHQVQLQPPAAGRPWEMATELTLPRGPHQLRVAAATADGATAGLLLTPFEIRAPGRDLAMTAPIILDDTDGRVHPTTVRSVVVGDPVGVQAEIAGRSVRSASVTVQASLLDATGTTVRSAPAALDAGSAPEIRRATAVFESTDLVPGAYTLLLEARGEKAQVVRRAVALELEPVTRPGAARASVVAHSVVAHGPTSRHAAASTHVITSVAEWTLFWAQLPTRQPAPDIDFSRVTVLAIVGSAGDGVPEIHRVWRGVGETVVHWRAPRGIASAVPVSAPFVAVGVVDRALGTVHFERSPAPAP